MSFFIEIHCKECGQLLDADLRAYNTLDIVIHPCRECLNQAEHKGYEDGEADERARFEREQSFQTFDAIEIP